MYTYSQVLWVKFGTPVQYTVQDSDRIMLYGWRRISSLGKIAANYRKLGEKSVKRGLPDLTIEIWDSIVSIAAYQDTWLERQAAQEAEEEKYAHIGKFV